MPLKENGLIKLMEEAGELVQAIAKYIQFRDIEYPEDFGPAEDFTVRIVEEMSDVLAAIDLVAANGIKPDSSRILMKRKRLGNWDAYHKDWLEKNAVEHRKMSDVTGPSFQGAAWDRPDAFRFPNPTFDPTRDWVKPMYPDNPFPAEIAGLQEAHFHKYVKQNDEKRRKAERRVQRMIEFGELLVRDGIAADLVECSVQVCRDTWQAFVTYGRANCFPFVGNDQIELLDNGREYIQFQGIKLYLNQSLSDDDFMSVWQQKYEPEEIEGCLTQMLSILNWDDTERQARMQLGSVIVTGVGHVLYETCKRQLEKHLIDNGVDVPFYSNYLNYRGPILFWNHILVEDVNVGAVRFKFFDIDTAEEYCMGSPILADLWDNILETHRITDLQLPTPLPDIYDC